MTKTDDKAPSKPEEEPEEFEGKRLTLCKTAYVDSFPKTTITLPWDYQLLLQKHAIRNNMLPRQFVREVVTEVLDSITTPEEREAALEYYAEKTKAGRVEIN